MNTVLVSGIIDSRRQKFWACLVNKVLYLRDWVTLMVVRCIVRDMTDEENTVDTSRKTVKTFVPAYQKEEWKQHAEELDMSQSEFVRTMVQAGRSDFEIEPIRSSEQTTEGVDEDNSREFGERVLSVLSESKYPSWDELVDRLVDDIEEQLDESLQRLQRENQVKYSGRHDGYAVVTENDEN